MENKLLKVDFEHSGKRADVVLSSLLSITRAQVQKMIKDGDIKLNGTSVKASYRIEGGEEFSVTIREKEAPNLTPYEIELDVRYEDEYLLVVNKPAGLVVHPSFGHKKETLVHALLARGDKYSDVNGVFRPGIVHRLDKETSGLLIVCKNNEVHNKIAKLLKKREITRRYTALVRGKVREEAGVIKTYLTRSKDNFKKMANTPATGKLAISHFKVKERFKGYMLLEVELETGRTHQIRAHLEFINTPIVGDALYGLKKDPLYSKGQLLHASYLAFTHPYTGELVEVSAELPDYFTKVLRRLQKDL
ncbi:MAG: RluA family pseudouridine synthase [Bacilli bacterium]|jgi:23S rRNA pseudouridine1911/1915/1917 synthase|nr:RluA family pseudouridine synthase [Bacillota bacterium]NLI52477.1 RluA family pseudouridine synthase [Erysipelotrichaceae bacterium]OQC49133.1 MAG: Ribosomal large subunit pseudouridine synthase D [Tenericutes bacterium ADurb.Bin024]HOE54152.1 RluA family pseudouridine synthase [Bacilli bacterium]HOH94696.1 RluA family pseudouridine synthase [Bacilli bacterium]